MLQSSYTPSFIKKILRALAPHNPYMLKQDTLGQQMMREGVLVIPFLQPEELTAVQAFYKEITQQYQLQFTHGMHMTLWHNDPVFKNKIKAGLLKIMKPAFERSFSCSRWLNNIFMVKQAHTTGEFAMHSDWSVVDETKYLSINVWMPLQDTGVENGGLWVIKGSHHMNLPIRGGGALLPDFSAVAEELKPFCKPVNAKAGEAVLFYHKTIHGSYPNNTNADRVVCTFSVIPQRATLRICFQKDKNSPLQIHEPPDDFNYKYNDLLKDTNETAPTKKPVDVKPPYTQKQITAADVLPFIFK